MSNPLFVPSPPGNRAAGDDGGRIREFSGVLLRRISVLQFFLIIAVVLLPTAPAWAQWATPTVDGSIGTGEYGTNNSLQNAGNTGQTWYMTWDASNLYVGIVNANLSEAAVIYIAPNPQNPPTCCSNADGNLTGFNNYDGTDFASLPFRAKFLP